MRAVIMETSNGYAAALKDDGTFIKIKDKNYHKGDVIDMKKFEFFTKNTMKLWIAAPVTCLILFAGFMGYAYTTPYYYVSLDVNPGITFEVNRFKQIIAVEAVNEDAKSIVADLNVKNKSIQDGLVSTVTLISDEGYFIDGNGEIYLSTAGKDNLKASELSLSLKTTVEEKNLELNIPAQVVASIFDLKYLEDAKNSGMTPGKYELLVNGLGLELTEANKELSVSELVEQSKVGKSSEGDYTNVMNAVRGYVTNDKALFLSGVAGIGDALPGIDKLSYGEAKQFFASFIEKHMGIPIKSSKLTEEEAIAQVHAFMLREQKEGAANDGIDITGLTYEQAQIKIESAQQERMRQELEALKSKAAQYDIDITGLSKDEAWKLVKEAEMTEQNANGPNLNNPEELKAQADKFGINIDGLTTQEAIDAVKRAMDSPKKETGGGSGVPDVSGCRSYAEKVGIDVSGLTDEQVLSKMKPLMLQTISNDLGISVSGLSEEDAWKLINETQWNKLIADLAVYGIDATTMGMSEAYDVLHEKNEERDKALRIEESWTELQRRAGIVGLVIDFSGMTLEDAEQKVSEAEAYYNVRKPLLEQAAQWGFDASGMSNEEIDAKISELLKSPHDIPTTENSN